MKTRKELANLKTEVEESFKEANNLALNMICITFAS